MRKNLLKSLAVAGLLLTAGACAPTRADLTLNWTFAGQTCQQAGVTTIQVDIQGEALSPNQFACANGNNTINTGAYLGRYLVGNYNLTLSGLDGQGGVLYQAVSTVAVRGGGSTVALDAPAARSTSGGSATLRYTFNGKSCAAASVSLVHISVDGAVLVDANNNADLPCSQGGIDGVSVSPLGAGNHVFDIAGLVNGQVAYVLQGVNINVVNGQDTAATPNLAAAAPTTGSAEITWTFVNGMTCAQAQVDSVHVSFDPAADGSGGTDAGTVPCSSGGFDGATFDGVSPGNHTVAITGLRHATPQDKLVYLTHTPPRAELFQAGITTSLDVSADAASPGKGGTALLWQFPAGGPSCTSTTTTTNIAYTLTDPSRVTTSGTAVCGASAGNGIDFCWSGSATAQCPGLAPGVWTISATAPGYAAQNVSFAVPENAHASANVVFVAH
jgi:hypothetical protein